MGVNGRIHIEEGSVQETLIIPLYGRKLCAEVFPALYNDEGAKEICERLDYDFTGLDHQANSTFWRFGALEVAMRQLDMQWEIRDYLKGHPLACVVNMGCGLDQTGSAADNRIATGGHTWLQGCGMTWVLLSSCDPSSCSH